MVAIEAGMLGVVVAAASSLLLLLVGGVLGGYLAGSLTSRIVVKMLRRNLGRLLDETDVGRALSKAGVDVFAVIGGLVKAFVFSIVFLAAVEYTGVHNITWQLLLDVALYLPRLVGGIAVLLLGMLLASALSKYTGKVLRSVVGDEKVAKLVETLLALSLLIVVVTIALNLMLLQGDVFYPLMLGVIVIGLGVYMGEVIVDELVKRHPDFSQIAPYAKFTVYLVFATTGLAAIFARFETVASTLSVLAWGVVMAIALTIAPLIYRAVRGEGKAQ
ncbi:conserved TM helix repeat-containing protein [Pyrolobus fumarii 1A]|uniref:Conserved TM helix repeat-containing protein n=1 Tax=Pyrolobus fumarii (strain DSM 11204 / 1A) TaxID=694429 RepID=G0EH54_PYRF1|nr:hypothetical protein [Pyrolobus fumarii]AEM39278.1 conserved TM helix repeat-containing protein [Pyrolobus fumarii 1A]